MYAIIDISSASVSMLVCEADPDRPLYSGREVFSAVSYAKDGKLTRQGMDRIVERIAVFQEQCKQMGVGSLYVISTASTRLISNSDEVLSYVLDHTGAVINRLDGKTEGWCGVAANAQYANGEDPVMIDLGGGSIEICKLSAKSKEEVRCLNFGAVTLQRKFVEGTFPDEKENKKIRKYIKNVIAQENIAEILPMTEKPSGKVVLVGATNRSLYEIYRDYYDLSTEGEMKIESKKLKKLVERLSDGHDRSQLLIRNAPEKSYFIVTAAILLLQMIKSAAFAEITVSERGVKEGFLRLLLAGEMTAQASALSPERPKSSISSVEELTAHIKRQSKRSRPPALKEAAKKGNRQSDDKKAAEQRSVSEEQPQNKQE